ncbi:MAG: M48 family metallopeptidase [Opitutae bacterium]|nr:M48 family metallopeptidase [Opitutae bacterium]
MPTPPRPPHARVLPWLLLLFGLAAIVRAAPPVFDPVKETEALLNTLPADARAKSDAYFEGGYIIQVWNLVLSLVIAWALLHFRVTVKLRDLAERFFQRRYLQGVLFIALFAVVSTVLNLPNDYYVGFIREHRFGLSNLTTGGWLGEQAKGLIVSVIIFSLVGSLLYQGIRRTPQRWWVLASLATPFFMLFLMVLAPVFVAPLFNKYTPLTDARVRDPILAMARANGVPVDNVYQFDASKQTKRISANVSGAFHTIRVSLNDNLLNRCPPAEVQAVMGHELGHYVLNHTYKMAVALSLVIAAGFWFAHWFYGAAGRRLGAGWGLRGIDDFAGLPLLLAGFTVFMFLATPVTNSIIRINEVEADLFGLNAAREPDAFARVALQLSEYRKLAPGKWEETIFFDHPSGYQRILAAMRWKAEYDPAIRMPDRAAEKN